MCESNSIACFGFVRSLTVVIVAGLAVFGPRTEVSGQSATGGLETVKALTFDVFGTVVDWRSSIIQEGELLTSRTGVQVDWPRFEMTKIHFWSPMQFVRQKL